MTTPPPSDPPTQPELDDTGVHDTEHARPGPDDAGPPPGWSAAGSDADGDAVDPSRGAGRGDGLGTAALVLGIVGVVLAVSVVGGFVLGVVALVFGILTLRRVRRGGAGRGQAVAGTVLGALAIVLSAATVALVLLAGINPLRPASLTSAAVPARGQLQQCVQQAHGDKAAVKQCRQQFGAPRRPGTAT